MDQRVGNRAVQGIQKSNWAEALRTGDGAGGGLAHRDYWDEEHEEKDCDGDYDDCNRTDRSPAMHGNLAGESANDD
jgi:hypothetical protein